MAELASLLACPRCGQTLGAEQPAGWHCPTCACDYPLIAGIPWLFAEPVAMLAEWRARARFTLQTLEHESAQYAAAARSSPPASLTQRRLELLAEATTEHRGRLREVLEPLGLDAAQASYPTNRALRKQLPADQGLVTYAYNIFRDWAWGEEENRASFELVQGLSESNSLGRVAVLGAGAGRLAYDLHMQMSAERTIVFDFNPFLLFVARHIAAGHTIELIEFPLAPRSLEMHAIRRRLSAPEPARQGLHFVLGDVNAAPFVPCSFDTVVTPWLVDILPGRFEDLCRRINVLLRDGGRWINFGSLSFRRGDPGERHSTEECVEIIAASGFDEPSLREAAMPYLCSPASRHGRRERVLGWRAMKRHLSAPARAVDLTPAWLAGSDAAVPLEAIYRDQLLSNQIRGYILSLIDGRRSIADIAEVLSERGMMPRTEAEAAIREYLSKLHDSRHRH